jgi:hypothetical protein
MKNSLTAQGVWGDGTGLVESVSAIIDIFRQHIYYCLSLFLCLNSAVNFHLFDISTRRRSMSNDDFDFSEEAKQTDQELSGDMQKLLGLSEEQLQQLLPNRVDQDELRKIIDAVNTATSDNEKKAALMQQLQSVSGVVRDVVKKVMSGGII